LKQIFGMAFGMLFFLRILQSKKKRKHKKSRVRQIEKKEDKMDDDETKKPPAKATLDSSPPPPRPRPPPPSSSSSSSSLRNNENGEIESGIQLPPGAVPSSPNQGVDRVSFNKKTSSGTTGRVIRETKRQSSKNKDQNAPLQLAPASHSIAVDSVEEVDASFNVPPNMAPPGATAVTASSPRTQRGSNSKVRQKRLSKENNTTRKQSTATMNTTLPLASHGDQLSPSEEEVEVDTVDADDDEDIPRGAFSSSSSSPSSLVSRRETRRAKRHVSSKGGPPRPVETNQGVNGEEGSCRQLAEDGTDDPGNNEAVLEGPVEPIQRDEDDDDDNDNNDNNNDDVVEDDVEMAIHAFVVPDTTTRMTTKEVRRAALLRIAENAPLAEVIQEGENVKEAGHINHHGQQRRKLLLFIAVLCVIVVVVVVSLLVVNLNNRNDDSTSHRNEEPNSFPPTGTPTDATTTSTPSQNPYPTEMPTGAPTTSLIPTMTPTTSAPTSNVFAIAASLLFTNPEQDRPRDPTSPQWKALQWLAEEDEVFQNMISGANNNNNGTTTVLFTFNSTKQLVRRYALATLYFATNGES
jgi:hypothetical protein